MGTNKKKGSRPTATKKQENVVKPSASGDTTEMGPSIPPQAETPSRNFTNPQLTVLILLVVGASKVWEWRGALFEVMELSSANNATNANVTDAGTRCNYYMMTDAETGIDFDDVCASPETATMMSLKYSYSLQMLALATYIMVKCWNRDDLLNRFSGFLAFAPISTTLLVLQICAPFLTQRPSLVLTCICTILMVLAASGASLMLREFVRGQMVQPSNRASVQSICLTSMICLNLYEMWQWFLTATAGGTSANSSILVLPMEWNDAWKVFLYVLMMDKFTIALLLAFVWLCLDEHRQRSILLVFATWKGVEYSMLMSEYDEAYFVDLASMKTTAVVCGVFSGIAWIFPNLHLADTTGAVGPSVGKNKKSTKVA